MTVREGWGRERSFRNRVGYFTPSPVPLLPLLSLNVLHVCPMFGTHIKTLVATLDCQKSEKGPRSWGSTLRKGNGVKEQKTQVSFCQKGKSDTTKWSTWKGGVEGSDLNIEFPFYTSGLNKYLPSTTILLTHQTLSLVTWSGSGKDRLQPDSLTPEPFRKLFKKKTFYPS